MLKDCELLRHLRRPKSRDTSESYRLAFVGGHCTFQNAEISPHRPCVRCVAIRIARLAFVGVTFRVRKRGPLEKGSFHKNPFSREFRDSRDFREPPICGKQRRIRPSSRDPREFRGFRDSRDSSSEKTPFVMTGDDPFLQSRTFVPRGIPEWSARVDRVR